MASSRWKRFAFFERQTLMLPNAVLDDVISSDTPSLANTANSEPTASNGNASAPASSGNTGSNGTGSNNNTNSSSNSNSTGSTASSRVALAISTASLPAHTRPSGRNTATGSSITTGSTTGSSIQRNTAVVRPVTTTQPPSHSQPGSEAEVNAISSMWASLTACSATEAFATSSATPSSTLNSIQLASQGQKALLSSEPTATSTSTSTTTILDGLVLAFVASPHSSRIHCIDLTVRCNPPSTKLSIRETTTSTSTGNGGASSNPITNATNMSTPNTVKATSKAITGSTSDDMDGWRGYWSPFAIGTTRAKTATTGNQSEPSANHIGVLAVATCRVPATGTHGHHVDHNNNTNNNHNNDTGTDILVTTSTQAHSPLHVACLGLHNTLTVWEDPHLHLSCRQPVHDTTMSPNSDQEHMPVVYTLPVTSTTAVPSSSGSSGGGATSQNTTSGGNSWVHWNVNQDGTACVLDIVPGMVAVGTDRGVLLILAYAHGPDQTTTTRTSINAPKPTPPPTRVLRPYLRIPAPPVTGIRVVSVQLSVSPDKANVFVVYNRVVPSSTGLGGSAVSLSATSTTAGICCYDLPLPSRALYPAGQSFILAAPSARHDLDGRYVSMPRLVDSLTRRQGEHTLTVARPDGVYSYSHTERTGVAPIDGSKLAICVIPPPVPAEKVREVDLDQVSSGYILVASTDTNSGRDVVDIYDSTNKLVAFHLLLSPGHRASCAAGVTTLPARLPDGNIRGGRSSAVVLTTGGALVSFTEKLTEEKISLLVHKHLYSAAIVVAYADPSYEASDVTALYQNYAEHLYRKGDFSGAIDQYIRTIGSLESSHVIFRFLDAPKIPLLVRYLEKLRIKELATPVHNELLRTCYLKLNDVQSAEAIAISTSWSVTDASLESIMSNLSTKPKDALATICSLDAHQAAEVLAIHGASLARVLPRETAGVVISLCLGSYSPKALAEASMAETLGEAAATTTAVAIDLNKMVNTNENPKSMIIDPYPVALFASSFVEHPKLLRLLLAHCNRNKCALTPSLRRALLELTLAEWNQAKRCGDTEVEKLRQKEAIAYLTDSHCHDIGDCDALVIVELAGFHDGALLLYERQQLIPFLLERYSTDGSDKARRQMLAMCNADPDVLADVLAYFVEMYSKEDANAKSTPDDGSDNDETAAILDDIEEALTLAKKMNIVPVRIARILAGEGSGQFTSDRPIKERRKTIPLHVALDYVGSVLEKSRKESFRLRSEIEEYNQLCNAMENEIDSLLCASFVLPTPVNNSNAAEMQNSRLNIDNLLARVKSDEGAVVVDAMTEQAREAFWREMIQSDDNFGTIARFFAKGVIG